MEMEDIQIKPELLLADMLSRVGRLETTQELVLDKTHEFDKELTGFKRDLQYIRQGLDKTSGGINKVLWGMAGIVGLYIMGFILNGGLIVPGVN